MLMVALVTMLLFSCSLDEKQEECKSSPKIFNPNGDSELALAMRKIFDQTEEIKQSLKNGELVVPADYIKNLKSFHTSTPTDPEVKVKEFFDFVDAIDLVANELSESTNINDQKEQYKRLVNTCIQCHKTFCPGPIRRINKLKLSK